MSIWFGWSTLRLTHRATGIIAEVRWRPQHKGDDAPPAVVADAKRLLRHRLRVRLRGLGPSPLVRDIDAAADPSAAWCDGELLPVVAPP